MAPDERPENSVNIPKNFNTLDDFTFVQDPLIEHVIDQSVGKEYKADEYIINSSAREIAKVRLKVFDAINRNQPNIICAACHTPVYPKRDFQKRQFNFVHVSENDCPYNEKKNRLNIKRIDSMRYNGQKEGPDHIKMKSLLRTSIDADSSFDPKETREEKNWYGAVDMKKWRRPDIAATARHGDKPLKIAFEIQLSATYLMVIAERRKFYLEENALLFWIFKDANQLDPRQYQDDLFFNNNSNLFVVDDETTRLSQEQGKLIFRCCYFEPEISGITINDVWRERIVSFDELTVDIDNQRVYWFDYSAEKEKLMKAVDEKKKEHGQKELRTRYENFWESVHNNRCENPQAEYMQLRQQLALHEIFISEHYDNSEIKRFTRMVYSAKTGEPFLTRYKTLLEVANFSYTNGKQFLWYFARVLQHYETWTVLLKQDEKAGKKKMFRSKKHVSWKEKGRIVKQRIDAGSPEYQRNPNYDKLFRLLFPEIVLPPG